MLEEILDSKLKDGLLKQGSVSNNDFIEQKNKESKLFYYLNQYEKNLVSNMHPNHIAEYSSGGGQELFDKSTPAKMKSLHSSSALTFNIIGNDPAVIKPNMYKIDSGEYTVQFEKQLETHISPAKANLDAFLLSSDKCSAVFCEMKMFEWLRSPQNKPVSGSYLDSLRYNNPLVFSVFHDLFKEYYIEPDSPDKMIPYRYDAPQMLKHSLGIYYSFEDARNNPKHELHGVKKVTLLNCVWEVYNISALGKESDNYINIINEEHDGFRSFRSKYQPVIDLFKKELNVELQLNYLNHKQFIDVIEKTLKEQEYLMRYCI